MITAQKRELLAAFDEKDFGIVWIRLVAKKNYRGSVFGLLRSVCHTGKLVADDRAGWSKFGSNTNRSKFEDPC